MYQLLALKALQGMSGVKLSFLFHPFGDELGDIYQESFDLYKLWGKLLQLTPELMPLESKVKLSEAIPELHPLALEFERSSKYGIRLTRSGEELLGLLEIDALLNLHSFILQGSILNAFPHGVWSFHHGDPLHYRGAPPGFWELYDQTARSGAVFQRLGERLDDGEILREVDLPTINHDYGAQRQALFAASIQWPASVAKELLETGEVKVKRASGRSRCGVRRRPTNREMLHFFCTYIVAKLRYQLEL